MTRSIPDCEAVTVTDTAAAVFAPLGVPDGLLVRWDLASPFQVRTGYVLRRDGTVVAAAFGVHRPLTGYEKLVGFWLADHEGDAVERVTQLLEFVLATGRESGAVAIKIELDPRAHTDIDAVRVAADAQGFCRTDPPALGAPYPHHHDDIPAGLVHWAPGHQPQRSVPYYRQSTDFTCGPAAVATTLGALGDDRWLRREEELRYWREANTIIGCDPLGLAVGSVSRGQIPRVLMSVEGPILLEQVEAAWDRDTRTFMQREFRRRADELGVEVHTEPFGLQVVLDHVRNGGIAVVLIDEYPMHVEPCPHWITVHQVNPGDADQAIVLVNDPWTDDHLGESWLDGADLPLPVASLDRLAQWGDPPYRAALLFAGETRRESARVGMAPRQELE